MALALWVIVALILISVVFLRKFMKDMAIVEDRLLAELKEMKQVLVKIHEKQKL